MPATARLFTSRAYILIAMAGRGKTKEELREALQRPVLEDVYSMFEELLKKRWSELLLQMLSDDEFERQLRDYLKEKLGAVLRDLSLVKGKAIKEITLWGWTAHRTLVYEKPWPGDEEAVAITLPREIFDEMDIGRWCRVAHRVVEYPGVRVAYMVIARSIGPYFDARTMNPGEASEEAKGTLHVLAERPPPKIDPVVLKLVLAEGWEVDVAPVVRIGPAGPTGFVLVGLPSHVRNILGIEPGDKITVFFRLTKDAVLEIAIPALAESQGRSQPT